jgi:hypothetical protein
MSLEAIKNFQEISLGNARLDTKRWQDIFDLKAFYFHRNDIECVIQEVAAFGVRFYIGIREEETVCPEMLLVGVGEEGNDLINTNDNAINSRIYDFTVPCPRACDFISKLNWNTRTGIFSENCAPLYADRTPSTPTTCNIAGFEIELIKARNIVANWQTLENVNLISVSFEKEELIQLFVQLNATAIRVYFGLDSAGFEKIILVGVDDAGQDLTDGKLFINTIPLCTKDNSTTCDTSSVLNFSRAI